MYLQPASSTDVISGNAIVDGFSPCDPFCIYDKVTPCCTPSYGALGGYNENVKLGEFLGHTA